MQRPPRESLGIIVVFLIVVGLFVTLSLLPSMPTRPASSSGDSCSASTSTDYQIYQCLNWKIGSLQVQMTSALARESVYLSSSAPSLGLRIAQRAQSAFTTYVHRECLAEANPYQPGTIVPIVYGDCALALYRQRLALIDAQINYFKAGGEAASAT